MINSINDDVRVQAQMGRLKIEALGFQLQGLILQDAFAQTADKTAAWNERRVAAALDEEERQLILKELADTAVASGSRARLASLAQDWADDAAMILMENVARKEAVEAVQDTYFDGHAILSCDIDDALETTIKTILEAIAIFNGYLGTMASRLRQDLGQQTSKDGNPPSGPGASTLTVNVEDVRGRTRSILY
jgi:hypothetical protein